MNSIRKALIYIYILTHAKAGWAYDRQSREVYAKSGRSENRERNNEPSHQGLSLKRKWRVCQRIVYTRLYNDCRLAICYVPCACKYEGRNISRNTHRVLRALSSRRLTSKEVAA